MQMDIKPSLVAELSEPGVVHEVTFISKLHISS